MIFVAIVVGLVGLALGPNLHHLAVRAGAKLPLERWTPTCRSCETPRAWRWVLACRVCGTRVTGRVLVVTVASGVLAGVASWTAGTVWLVPAYLVFALVTLVLVVTDLDHKLIPNRVLYPGTSAAGFLLGLGALVVDRLDDLGRGLVGAGAYFGILFVVALIARGGFGFGDVKLAALLGLFTAFESLRIFLLAIFFTGVIGGIPAIVLLVARRARPKDELPYGPAMVAGAWLALVVGEPFLRWYTG